MTQYIIYKTTNLLNDKFYIGLHKTNSAEFDGYYGSGTLLKQAIKKYGKENFKRETLYSFDTLDAARQKEREIVTIDFTQDSKTYNLSVGGTGGNTIAGYTEHELIEYKTKLMTAKQKRKQYLLENNLQEFSPEIRQKMSVSAKQRLEKYPHTIPNNKGRIYTESGLKSVQAASKKRKDKFIYINDGTKTILHLATESIPTGFSRGFGPDRQRLKQHTEKTKQYMREISAVRGTTAYNNGVVTIRLKPDSPIPEGFVKGLLVKNKVKTIWITDGINSSKHLASLPIPPGYINGRTFKSRKGKSHDE